MNVVILVKLSSCSPDSSTQLVKPNHRTMATGALVRPRRISATSAGTATTGQVNALTPSTHQTGKATNSSTSGQVIGRRSPLVPGAL